MNPIKSGNYNILPQVITIQINTPLVWNDIDQNGKEIRTVDGSQSTVSYGNIASYEWILNGQVISTTPTFELELPSGSKFLTLKVATDYGLEKQDSVEITVLSSKDSKPAAQSHQQ